MEKWPQISKVLNEDDESLQAKNYKKLIGYLCKVTSLIDDVQNSSDDFSKKDAGLYQTLCQVNSSESLKLWCRQGLEGLGGAAWTTELRNEGSVLDLLLSLKGMGIEVELKQPLQDALVEHAKKVLAGKITVSDKNVFRWNEILDTLGMAAREVLRSRLRDAAMQHLGKYPDQFFVLYGKEISSPAILKGNQEIVRKLLSPLVQQRASGGIHWLKAVFVENEDILNSFQDSADVEDFRERLQGELDQSDTGDDEVHMLLVEIANILGIKKKIPIEGEEEMAEPDSGSESKGVVP
jgi:hypothetical protein